SFMPGGPLFEVLPNLPIEDSIVFRERLLRLPGGDSDTVAVSGRILRRGMEGLLARQAFADAAPAAKVKIILAAIYPIFPDAVITEYDALDGDDEDASSQVRYEAACKSILEPRPDGSRAVALSFIPPRIISAGTRNMTARRTACHIKMVHTVEERNSFLIPDNAVFTRLPRPAYIPSRFGVYQLRFLRLGNNRIEVIRNYHIQAQRISPWEWSNFLNFLDRLDVAEKQWVEYSIR
ncbi:MAG: hypothetical protein FWG74_09025, partial [Planctomycetes bacterium]|nr:hypothetical protein [Planctomycetota bacterium]